MTRVAILIPCHINYEGQINLLDNCLNSLLEQTILPESIYISASFDDERYKKDFGNNIIRKYAKITEPKFYFLLSKEQKYQMEHLSTISSKINHNYDMLMFCDDDDTYDRKRVQLFVHAFECGKSLLEKFGGVRECHSDDPKSEAPEYWCYGIGPNVIKDFFRHFKDDQHYRLLKHKFGDMYFRYYLRKTKKYLNWSIITLKLYKYNVNNPNSICGKIQNGKEKGNIEDNFLLKILDFYTDDEICEMISREVRNKEMKYKLEYIHKFCISLGNIDT